MDNHRTFEANIWNTAIREQVGGIVHISDETIAFETDLHIILEAPIEEAFAWDNDFGNYISVVVGEIIYTAEISAEVFEIIRCGVTA